MKLKPYPAYKNSGVPWLGEIPAHWAINPGFSAFREKQDEQDAIAAFLAHADRRINRLIRAKRRLIELLHEQKQAIINRAVTRGLDPNVRFKHSGIEGLGEVPGHWEVRTLKQVASIRLSGVDKHSVEGEIPVRLCNYTDVYNRDDITPNLNFMHATATATEISAFTLKADDVLITKDSELWEDIAVPALVRADLEGVLCGYHLALIRSYRNLLIGEYLFQAFSTPVLARQFSIAATGVTRYGLSKHAIKNAVFLLPPLNEQEQICRWIKDELQPIYASIERAQREINLIREYHTRLIADVVTGKVDVRNVKCEERRVKEGDEDRPRPGWRTAVRFGDCGDRPACVG